MMLNNGAYTLHHAALISLIFLIAFFFFGAHHWEVPSSWHDNSAHTPSMELNKGSPLTNSGLIDRIGPSNLTISTNGLLISTGAQGTFTSTSSLNSTSKETVASMATRQAESLNSSATSIGPRPETLGLRSLEAGLQMARSSLRKVVAMDKNHSRTLQVLDNQKQDYLPWGPIYRDASVFQQSYIEMERRFKVFIYPEGSAPLVHTGPCTKVYSIEGRFIQELEHNHHFVTSDPYKAHVFFLPFSVYMMVRYLYTPKTRGIGPLLHFVKDYVEVISAKYPFWNRSLGADHFMLSCHDWGPWVSKAQPGLEKHAIRVLCNANSSESFFPDKDASLPEVKLIGGYVPAPLGGPSMKDRKVLGFFAGYNHGPVRPILYKYWEGRDDDIKVFHGVPANATYTYQDFMKRSKFCLCPAGYEVNTPRIVEAIYNDCIPVIIADGFVLPFSDVLDWDAFSIKVMKKDIPKLKEILQAIPESKCEEMQARVKQVKRHFLLNQPVQPFDLFHMILHSVWLRRLNIRLHYH